MSRTFHLRGVPLTTVVDRVTERLRAEGFTPFVEAPVEAGSYRMPDPAVRRLVVLATPDSDWVTLADDSFATTAWGERLSKTFERPVLYMAGECDHAFFTHAVVYEAGAEVARAEVPRDVVLDDDGRHRIRPVSLARIAPEATAALEAGVVVDDLGGEQNVVAIGRALGIADAMPDPFYLPDGATLLTFRFEKRPDGVDYLPNERDPLGLGSMLGDEGLAALEDLPAGEAGMAALLGSVMKGFAASAGGWEICDVREVPEVREPEGPVRIDLHARSGRVGDPAGVGFHGSIALRDDHEAPLTGLDIEIGGDALAFLDIDRLTIEPLDGSAPPLVVEGVVTTDGARRFALPELVLRHPARDGEAEAGGARGLPLGEALRQSVRDRFGLLRRFTQSRETAVRMSGAAVATSAGSGSLTVRVVTSAGTTDAEPITLEAREPLRLPRLPEWVDAGDPSAWRFEHDVPAYRGKEHVVGWLGFKGPWSDVAALATRIAARIASVASDLGGAPFAAHADVADGTLTFNGPVRPDASDATWKKLLPALARGAEVELHTGERFEGGASIMIGHRPRGFVGMPDMGDERVRELDLVPIHVSWSIPAPSSRDARAKLTEALEEVLIEAGAVSASVGGFAGTQGVALQRIGDPPYVSMARTRGLDWKTRWLESHVRTPAWLVLAPPAAAAKLGTTPNAPRVETEKLAHATLIRSTAADPFVYDADDSDAMESFVMPAIGSADEIPRE